jgi:hypothetical protein
MSDGDQSDQEPEPLALRILPESGECFDSWIERVAAAHETNRPMLFRHLGIDESMAKLDLARGTFGLPVAEHFPILLMVGRLAWAVQTEADIVEATFLNADGSMLLPRRLRRYVCVHCWQEAGRNGRPPIILKQWILRMSWRCRLHDLPLCLAPMAVGRTADPDWSDWLGGALARVESLRGGLDYRVRFIEWNAICLDKLARGCRKRIKGPQQSYLERFQANLFHFSHDRIAMLALAHSRKGGAVWGFERLTTIGLPERPEPHAESLKRPKPPKRAMRQRTVHNHLTVRRATLMEPIAVLRAYADLRQRRDDRVMAQARFGRISLIIVRIRLLAAPAAP